MPIFGLEMGMSK